MSAPLRVAVIGAGLIGQGVHIPLLQGMPDKFQLVGVADTSARVCRELAARYPRMRTSQDWGELLDIADLDAIFICSPNATHSQVALAALNRGLHVFAEKPLAITVDDIDAIIAARDARRLVVQVGYMKRFDAGYASLLSSLPKGSDSLRLIDVVTYDPWMARVPFAPADLIPADDVPTALRDELNDLERIQVEVALGPIDDASVRTFVDVYLGALIHDVNLVHGVLAHLGIDLPARPVFAGHRDDGRGVSVMFEVQPGVQWHCSWLLLSGQEEFNERVQIYFDDAIHHLHFDAPYFRGRPSVHEIRTGQGPGRQRALSSVQAVDAYAEEIKHFYSCVVHGTPCRTPPEQARVDTVALTEAFHISQTPAALPTQQH